MAAILSGKMGIITGALNEDSLAWKVAEKAFSEGGKFVLTNTPVALRAKFIDKLAENTNSVVIPADLTNITDISNLYEKATEFLGGKIDFILHAAAMSVNVRKRKPYHELDYDYYLKALDVSAISLHKLLQIALKNDFINEWGSVVALTYIAAQRTVAGYGDMAEAKSALESITRNFGYIYGKKRNVRINTVSQSPVATPATSIVEGFGKLYEYTARQSPLGNASAEDCASFIVTLFSDYTRMVTMQNIYHDGGFSSMAISEDVL